MLSRLLYSIHGRFMEALRADLPVEHDTVGISKDFLQFCSSPP
jgi:hypothetical protein